LRGRIATARKYGPAARDYALFRTLYHARLRADEASMFDQADQHFGRGLFGKLHVRFGKGARTSGPRPRRVPMLIRDETRSNRGQFRGSDPYLVTVTTGAFRQKSDTAAYFCLLCVETPS